MIRSQPFQFACVSGEGRQLGSGVSGSEGLRVLESEAPTGPSDATMSSVPPERLKELSAEARIQGASQFVPVETCKPRRWKALGTEGLIAIPAGWWWQVTRPRSIPIYPLGTEARRLQSAEDGGPVLYVLFCFFISLSLLSP